MIGTEHNFEHWIGLTWTWAIPEESTQPRTISHFSIPPVQTTQKPTETYPNVLPDIFIITDLASLGSSFHFSVTPLKAMEWTAGSFHSFSVSGRPSSFVEWSSPWSWPWWALISVIIGNNKMPTRTRYWGNVESLILTRLRNSSTVFNKTWLKWDKIIGSGHCTSN